MVLAEAGAWVAGKTLEHSMDALLQDRSSIKNLMASAWARLFEGKSVVVINGLGGAGKTTLQQILSGQKSIGELDPTYQVSLSNEVTSVKGDYFTRLFTRPGQSDNLRYNDGKITTALMKADRIVFINVVTYGYNSLYSIPLSSVPGYSPGNTQGQTLSTYLDIQRRDEIQRLRDFCDLLKAIPEGKKIEILTVVNKLDLWWNESDAVRNHYSSSEYANIVKDLITAKSSSFARHNIVPVCLILSNIRTSDNEVLAHPTAGFDILLQNINFKSFSRVVEKFLPAR